MLRSLVGSEMCIRDRVDIETRAQRALGIAYPDRRVARDRGGQLDRDVTPVSYTHLTLPTIYSV